MIYRVVKLVTTLRPNLGFFSRTPAPPASELESAAGFNPKFEFDTVTTRSLT